MLEIEHRLHVKPVLYHWAVSSALILLFKIVLLRCLDWSSSPYYILQWSLDLGVLFPWPPEKLRLQVGIARPSSEMFWVHDWLENICLFWDGVSLSPSWPWPNSAPPGCYFPITEITGMGETVSPVAQAVLKLFVYSRMTLDSWFCCLPPSKCCWGYSQAWACHHTQLSSGFFFFFF